MKSRGLFPGPRSRPKRTFASAAGNSEYKHNLPNTDGFKDGMSGWKASRMGGGASNDDRFANRPVYQDKSLTGDGGFAYDASCEPYLENKGQPEPSGKKRAFNNDRARPPNTNVYP